MIEWLSSLDLWILIASGLVLLGLLVLAIVLIAKRIREKGRKVDSVKIKKGVRYTLNELVVDKEGNVKISLNKGDVLLLRGKDYVCKKKKGLMPGKYTVLSASEDAEVFNIRVGGFVREYKHFESIVLVEKDVITAVSHNIILR